MKRRERSSLIRYIITDAEFCIHREIDGTVYKAYVKEKEEAKRVYTQAQSLGQTAGLVEVRYKSMKNYARHAKPRY